MMFDKLCGMVERFTELGRYRYMLEESKIFIFPYKAHEIKGLHQKLYDEFFLPFPVVAIEDRASCVIIMDTVKDQVGFKEPRYFLEYLPIASDDSEFSPIGSALTDSQKDSLINRGVTCSITSGVIKTHFIRPDGRVVVGGGVNFFGHNIGKNKFNIISLAPDSAMQNPMAAIEELLYFNSEDRFILEEINISSLKKRGKKGASKKILRSHDRSMYTILEPKTIRTKMGIDLGDRSRISTLEEGHDRRAHWRYLQHDKYSEGGTLEKKVLPSGLSYYKKVLVPSTWVGPSEVTIRNKRYRVRTDL